MSKPFSLSLFPVGDSQWRCLTTTLWTYKWTILIKGCVSCGSPRQNIFPSVFSRLDDVVLSNRLRSGCPSVCRFPNNQSVISDICSQCCDRSWIYCWKDEALLLLSLSLSHQRTWLAVGTDCVSQCVFSAPLKSWQACVMCFNCEVLFFYYMGFTVRNNQPFFFPLIPFVFLALHFFICF